MRAFTLNDEHVHSCTVLFVLLYSVCSIFGSRANKVSCWESSASGGFPKTDTTIATNFSAPLELVGQLQGGEQTQNSQAILSSEVLVFLIAEYNVRHILVHKPVS